MTLRTRHTVIAALLCGTFISIAPAFAGGGVLGGVGGTISGGGTLGASIPNLPPAPVGKVGADVGVGADVNGRAAVDTVTGTAGTLRGNAETTVNKGVRIVSRTGAEVKGSAEAVVDAGAAKAEGVVDETTSAVSAADAKLNLEATASSSSDVSSSLKAVGKANAEASGDAWFDIF